MISKKDLKKKFNKNEQTNLIKKKPFFFFFTIFQCKFLLENALKHWKK